MLSTNAIDDLSALGRYRWIVPVMALLADRNGARFVEMLKALGISRESLVRTLEGAMQTGWVVRNSGHGHPLRPEYLLTAEGARVAQICIGISNAQNHLCIAPAELTRWSLPIIGLISDGRSRFNSLERALAPATPRALTQSLKTMMGQELVSREVIAGYPPASRYDLTRRGGVMADALQPFAA
jgi:DNA-binding HxlR family transcriptional regulator